MLSKTTEDVPSTKVIVESPDAVTVLIKVKLSSPAAVRPSASELNARLVLAAVVRSKLLKLNFNYYN